MFGAVGLAHDDAVGRIAEAIGHLVPALALGAVFLRHVMLFGGRCVEERRIDALANRRAAFFEHSWFHRLDRTVLFRARGAFHHAFDGVGAKERAVARRRADLAHDGVDNVDRRTEHARGGLHGCVADLLRDRFGRHRLGRDTTGHAVRTANVIGRYRGRGLRQYCPAGRYRSIRKRRPRVSA